jgi:hypothetical protein
MKYPDHAAVFRKIDELFAFRQITALIGMADPPADPAWTEKLKELQYRIYLLDAFLEGEWDLDPEERRNRWADIRAALSDLGYDGGAARLLLAEIRRYERIERDCRKDKWPTRIGFRKFYTTKSCDVRLIRRLVYLAHPSLAKDWPEATWRFFDRVAEVHDDVEDVREDLETWNANRFLVALLRDGIPATHARYAAFVTKTLRKATRYFSALAPDDPALQVAALTADMGKQTMDLLEETITHLPPDLLSRSWMLGRMA